MPVHGERGRNMSANNVTRPFDRASDNRPAGVAMSSPDLDRYRPYVAHLDIPDARKDDMILAVWRVMRNAVDRASVMIRSSEAARLRISGTEMMRRRRCL